MHGVPKSGFNRTLKKIMAILQDSLAAVAGSHGFRRGLARDMAMDGGTLKEILAAGDWRSAAFKAYIHSVREDLSAAAVMTLLGETSDSDAEGPMGLL